MDEIPTCTLDFDPSAQCFIHTWVGFTSSEEFRSFLGRSFDIIREKIQEHGKLGWISDISQAQVFSPEDVSWVTENWNPRAYKEGIKHIVFIMPESVFTKMNLEDYTELTNKTETMVVNHVDNIESAKNWLKEVLNSEQ